jgi:hypothetical protein
MILSTETRPMIKSLAVLATLALLVPACSSSSDDAGGGGTSAGGGAGSGGVSSAGGGAGAGGGGVGGAGGAAPAQYALKYMTQPGEETHWCEYRKMPKSESSELLVSGVDWSWGAAHHWGLYRLVPNAPLADLPLNQPFDCFNPTGAMQYAQFSSAFLQGEAQGEISFPEGTAFPFQSEEIVIFQTHTINTTAAPVEATLDVSFRVADPAKVQNKLGLIQFYDPYIYVPAHADAKAQMRCQVPQDITLVRSTTHQHIRGVGVETFLDSADGTPGATPFVSSKTWDTPPVLNDLVKVTQGQYIRTVCHYKGDDHTEVVQGQFKGDKEMCMTIAYYYPVVAADMQPLFENCIQNPFLTPQGAAPSFGDSFGTGAKACFDTLNCVQGVLGTDPTEAPNGHDGQIDVGPNFQKCIVDSCPSASTPLFKTLTCVQANCAKECADPTTCQSCAISKCLTEVSACMAHSCAP